MSGVWRALKLCVKAGTVGTDVRRHITPFNQSVSVPAGFDASADAYSQIRQIVLGTDRRCRRVEPAALLLDRNAAVVVQARLRG
jgi:hypothetical protein